MEICRKLLKVQQLYFLEKIIYMVFELNSYKHLEAGCDTGLNGE